MAFPVLSRAEMRTWERATWAAGGTESEVIDKVGKAIAHRLLALTTTQQRILIIAGKGNNGADARAVVPYFAARHFEVVEVQEPKTDLAKLKERLTAFRPDWILDGLFGIGLSRPLDENWQEIIQVINGSGSGIVAVDIPSGLDCDTGMPMGAAITADLTLTVGAPKVGMLRCEAAEHTGRIEVLGGVGLSNPPDPEGGCYWTADEDFAGIPPKRRPISHKGTFGHLTILAGSSGYHGAAILAARGALRARPGLVSVVTLPAVYLQLGSQLAAAMVHRWKAKQSLPEKTTAVLAGPGLAALNIPPDYRDWIQRLWRESFLPVVADASALDWIPRRAVGSNPGRVITPHPGEAARMLRIEVPEVQADRVRALRELSKLYGDSWVVLKGHQTLVGRAAGPIYVNSSGNPGLSQGGTGDVLAGFIAGLIAQPALIKDPCLAVRYAVWAHGHAADCLEARCQNWSSEELAEELGSHPSRNSGSIWRTQRTGFPG